MDPALEADVKKRAQGVCEFCRLPEACQRVPFQIDHIIAEQHDGATVFENLANACLRCNKKKGSKISVVDSLSGEMVRLFNPRRDQWNEHFEWRGAEPIGLTSIGRATVAVLAINVSSAVALREELIAEGLFPPP
jgi:hypothetical protein